MSRVQLPTPTSGGRVHPTDVHMRVICCASTGKKGEMVENKNECMCIFSKKRKQRLARAPRLTIGTPVTAAL